MHELKPILTLVAEVHSIQEGSQDSNVMSSPMGQRSQPRTINIRQTDMPEEGIEFTKFAIQKAFSENGQDRLKNIAGFIKHSFEAKFYGKWHCVIGKSFGSNVSHGKS